MNCITLIIVGLLSVNNAYSESFWEKAKREAAEQYKKVEKATKKTVDDLVTGDEKEQESENTSTASSDLNQDKNSVTSAQTNLKKLGLYDGTLDCIYGRNTRRAISKFENFEGMARTGDVTQNLLTNLETAVSQGKFYGTESKPKVAQEDDISEVINAGNAAASEPVKSGKNGGSTFTAESDEKTLHQNRKLVMNTHVYLNKLGLYDGKVNDTYGPEIRNSILRYEQIKGLKQSGNITADLYRALKNSYHAGEYYGEDSNKSKTQTATPSSLPQTVQQSNNQQTNKGGNKFGIAVPGSRSYEEIEVEANSQPPLTRKMLVEALDGSMTVSTAAAHLQARGYAPLRKGSCNYRRTTQESEDTVTLGTDKGWCKDGGAALKRVTKIIIPTSGKVDYPVYKLRLHKAMGGVGRIELGSGQYAWNNPATMPDIKRFHVASNNNPSGIREMAEFKK